MKTFLILLAALSLFEATPSVWAQCSSADWMIPTVTAKPVNNPLYKPGWHWVFDDEFEGTTIDGSLWKKFQGFGDGMQYYAETKPENMSVSNGRCHLRTVYAPKLYTDPSSGQSKWINHTSAWIGTWEPWGPNTFWELRCRRNGLGYKSSAWSYEFTQGPTGTEGISLFDNDFNPVVPNVTRQIHFEPFEASGVANPKVVSTVYMVDMNNSIPASDQAEHVYSVDCTSPLVKFYVNNEIAVKEGTYVPTSTNQEFELWCHPLYWNTAYQQNPQVYQPGSVYPDNSFDIDYFRIYKKNAEVLTSLTNYGVSQSWSSQQTRPRLIGDFNNDKKKDIIGFGVNNTSVSLSSTTNKDIAFLNPANVLANYTVEQGWTNQNQRPRMVGDVNNDGKADIVGFGWQAVNVSLSTSTASTPSFTAAAWVIQDFTMEQGWTNQDQRPRDLADVNGDGKLDIVGFGWQAVRVALSTSTSTTPSFTSSFWTINNFTVEQGWSNQLTRPRMFIDLNKDGKADIIGFGPGGTFVSLSTSTLTTASFASPVQVLADFSVEQGWTDQEVRPRMVADVNGDGKPDIVGFGNTTTYVSLNTTNGNVPSFAPPVAVALNFTKEQGFLTASTHPRYVVDINNDSMADIVAVGDNMIRVAISKSTASAPIFENYNNFIDEYTPCKDWNNVDQYPRFLSDMNGDGSLDFVGFGFPGVMTFQSIGGTYNLPFTVTSSNAGKSNDWDVTGPDGADVAYKFFVKKASTVQMSLVFPPTNYPALIQVFNATTGQSMSSTSTSSLTLNLQKGYYYVVVDGVNGATGNFKLQAN